MIYDALVVIGVLLTLLFVVSGFRSEESACGYRRRVGPLPTKGRPD